MVRIQTLIVRLGAVIFGVYGLAFVLAPEMMAQFVTGAAPKLSSPLIDMRATYGGMSVGVGALLYLLSIHPNTLRQGLLGVLLLMLGMGGARAYGILVDGSPNLMMYVFLAVELATAVIAVAALKLSSPPRA